ncbi:MAG: hydroxymethylbilane synthase [Actinobacteria bacterium]|nr:hydroxymethylbilane synthase [Actinomycetota bacterium]
MTTSTLRIATRSSALARWQADHVAGLLKANDPAVRVEFVSVTTDADRRLDVPIAEIGGKGVFAKEVQLAVLEGRADCAVHSAKDLTAVTLEGLTLAAVPGRGDPRDALAGRPLDQLPPGAVVGTGSARRRVQLAAMRDDLDIVGIRGNIATRLSLLDELDAIVVAHAALERLGLQDRAAQIFEIDAMIPQVAQGALAVECRADDTVTRDLLGAIEHAGDRLRVDVERAFLARLGGDCDLPAGAHAAYVAPDRLRITGVLAADAASVPVRRTREVSAARAEAIEAAARLADELRDATGPAS